MIRAIREHRARLLRFYGRLSGGSRDIRVDSVRVRRDPEDIRIDVRGCTSIFISFSRASRSVRELSLLFVNVMHARNTGFSFLFFLLDNAAKWELPPLLFHTPPVTVRRRQIVRVYMQRVTRRTYSVPSDHGRYELPPHTVPGDRKRRFWPAHPKP